MPTSSAIRKISAFGVAALILSGCSSLSNPNGSQISTNASSVDYANFGPKQPASGFGSTGSVITGGSTGTFGTTDAITVDSDGPFPDNASSFDASLTDLSAADRDLLAGSGIDFDAERLATSEITFPGNSGGTAYFDTEIGTTVYFDTNGSTLSDGARATLRKQAAWLTVNSDVIATVEGHADERGTREFNIALGERRASAVRGYLTALGVDDQRVRKVSYGKERPAVPGSNERAWSQNRRTVTTLERPAQPSQSLSSITSDLARDPLTSGPSSTVDELLNDPVLNDLPAGDPLLDDPLLNDPLLNDPLLNDV